MAPGLTETSLLPLAVGSDGAELGAVFAELVSPGEGGIWDDSDMTIRVLVADDQAVVRAGFRVVLGSAADIEVVLWMLGWFLLGYFLFAGLLAAAGARVSRQEEVQSAINPVLTVLVVLFVLSVFLLGDDPESPLVIGLSLVPPFSPILMPARIALDVAPLWQVGAAAAVTIIAITAVVAIAGRVYAGAVLRTGSRVTLADALRPR